MRMRSAHSSSQTFTGASDATRRSGIESRNHGRAGEVTPDIRPATSVRSANSAVGSRIAPLACPPRPPWFGEVKNWPRRGLMKRERSRQPGSQDWRWRFRTARRASMWRRSAESCAIAQAPNRVLPPAPPTPDAPDAVVEALPVTPSPPVAMVEA